VAVSGGLDRVRRLGELEEKLSGGDVSAVDKIDVKRMATMEFGRKPSGSPEYLSEMAALQVERGLRTVLLGEVVSR
jgi:CO/xanthine dehydrogenase FAD-binding subunit